MNDHEDLNVKIARIDENVKNVIERIQGLYVTLNSHNQRLDNVERCIDKLSNIHKEHNKMKEDIFDLKIFRLRAYWTFGVVMAILILFAKLKGLW